MSQQRHPPMKQTENEMTVRQAHTVYIRQTSLWITNPSLRHQLETFFKKIEVTVRYGNRQNAFLTFHVAKLKRNYATYWRSSKNFQKNWQKIHFFLVFPSKSGSFSQIQSIKNRNASPI